MADGNEDSAGQCSLEVPPWVPELVRGYAIALHKEAEARGWPEIAGCACRLATDARMKTVWYNLRHDDRKTGGFQHRGQRTAELTEAARTAGIIPQSGLVQENAMATLFFAAVLAAATPAPQTKGRLKETGVAALTNVRRLTRAAMAMQPRNAKEKAACNKIIEAIRLLTEAGPSLLQESLVCAAPVRERGDMRVRGFVQTLAKMTSGLFLDRGGSREALYGIVAVLTNVALDLPEASLASAGAVREILRRD